MLLVENPVPSGRSILTGSVAWAPSSNESARHWSPANKRPPPLGEGAPPSCASGPNPTSTDRLGRGGSLGKGGGGTSTTGAGPASTGGGGNGFARSGSASSAPAKEFKS